MKLHVVVPKYNRLSTMKNIDKIIKKILIDILINQVKRNLYIYISIIFMYVGILLGLIDWRYGTLIIVLSIFFMIFGLGYNDEIKKDQMIIDLLKLKEILKK